MKNTRSQGFTLVEMSIVLVIIGAILGGVVLGKSLITASKLQTVITDVDSYTTAVTNFKQVYQGLPGNFYNAEVVWGTDNLTCPTGGGTSGTCKGSGNGQILNPNGAIKAGEPFLFWQHLYLAGMFSMSLSNQAGSGGAYDSKIGTNVPPGSVKGSGFSVSWLGTVVNGNANYFWGSGTTSLFYGNIISFGSQVSGNLTYGPILTPEQAAGIDTKMDDGAPATGKVRAMISTSAVNPGCTTTAVSTTALYTVANGTNICSLIFVMGF